jgi:SagB-type dehydrogenase family enzyme
VRASRYQLDRENKPRLYRTYPGADVVALPPPRVLDQPALDAIAARGAPKADSGPALELDLLGTILFLTGGITRTLPSGRDIRATAAAGALYPNELYVVTAELPSLAAGLYHYDARGARLARLRAGDWRAALARAADDAEIRSAPATMVITGVLWRSAWKYRERAYRHLYWDGGMMLAHMLAAANAAGLPATVLAGFVDAEVDRLLGIDGQREGTIALVRLGTSAAPAADTPVGDVPPPAVQPSALSSQPIDYPEALRYHAASRLADAAAVRLLRAARVERATPAPGGAVQTLPVRAAANATLDAVVRRRSSTRRFAQRPISAQDLGTILSLPTRGVPADFLRAQSSLLETYVIVHAVTGVAPGAYYYRPSEQRLEALAAGDFRSKARFLCLNQALAGDASAVVFYLADLERVGDAFGERGYRLAELEAGVRAGRAYLAAYAVGRGVSGLTFFDDEVTHFFSPHAAGLEPLLVVALGVPAKR